MRRSANKCKSEGLPCTFRLTRDGVPGSSCRLSVASSRRLNVQIQSSMKYSTVLLTMQLCARSGRPTAQLAMLASPMNSTLATL